ncbi:hypothetical protein [Neptunitalea chrysea]|uniref:hypothetical protein n=1 Tax=Neptunitalea chrysea TaxID=1647581 RepID=UPI0024934455|nr:hypothetical protein [Neptunitalea chrysea]
MDLPGIYVSKKPSLGEKMSIMYSKGYYNFVYTPEENDTLTIEENGKFKYSSDFCKVGLKGYDGDWELRSDSLFLDFSYKTHNSRIFISQGNLLYTIEDFSLSGSNETMKCITLLEKR